jgi:hypothetical protein
VLFDCVRRWLQVNLGFVISRWLKSLEFFLCYCTLVVQVDLGFVLSRRLKSLEFFLCYCTLCGSFSDTRKVFDEMFVRTRVVL